MHLFFFIPFFAISILFFACSIEHAQEQVIANHVNGVKKTSIWIYPNGEILKRNEWYNDGIKELEIPYKNNVPHGTFKRWTGFGDVAMIGSYKNGLRDGEWISYYSNKKIEAKRYFKEDHPIKDWEAWYHNVNSFTHNQQKKFEEHYDNKGDSVGIWKKWYENGNIKEETSCFNNNPNGFIRTYYENGRKKSEHSCKYGKWDGLSYSFYDNNQNTLFEKAEYKQGNLKDTREYYFSSGEIQKKESWVNNIREGIWTWYSLDGNTIAQTDFINGTGVSYGICPDDPKGLKFCAETTFVKKNPEKLWYFKIGHILRYEEIWENGKKTISKSYYPDSLGGKIASEGFWENEKRNGIWRNWYSSGVLRDSLNYINGERIGEQFSYDSTGKLTIHKTENGKNRPIIMHITR